MYKENTLKDEVQYIIDMIDDTIEERKAREPNAMAIRNLLRAALVKSGHKPKE